MRHILKLFCSIRSKDVIKVIWAKINIRITVVC